MANAEILMFTSRAMCNFNLVATMFMSRNILSRKDTSECCVVNNRRLKVHAELKMILRVAHLHTVKISFGHIWKQIMLTRHRRLIKTRESNKPKYCYCFFSLPPHSACTSKHQKTTQSRRFPKSHLTIVTWDASQVLACFEEQQKGLRKVMFLCC